MKDDGCDYCADHVPAKGYWRCPMCDAEWPDEDGSASEALQILTLDTPSRSIQPDMMNQLQQLMKKEFGYV